MEERGAGKEDKRENRGGTLVGNVGIYGCWWRRARTGDEGRLAEVRGGRGDGEKVGRRWTVGGQ